MNEEEEEEEEEGVCVVRSEAHLRQEQSLARIARLDERLHRLDQLGSRLDQLRSRPRGGENTQEHNVTSLLLPNTPWDPDASAQSGKVLVEPSSLRQLMREELQSFFASGEGHLVLEATAKSDKLAELQPGLNPPRDGHRSGIPEASDEPKYPVKAAWEADQTAGKPSSLEAVYEYDQPSKGANWPVLETLDDNPVNADNQDDEDEASLHATAQAAALYAQVESRKALLDMLETGPSDDTSGIQLRTLADTTPVSLNYFLGGFTHSSPVRMKCFQMFNSSRWKAFFLAINLANCLTLTIIPEVNLKSFNAVDANVVVPDRRAHV